MQRRGLLPTTIAGIVVMAGSLGALCLLPTGAPVWLASLLMVPVGVGGSFTVPPLTALVMNSIPAERAGVASGVLNTARQMGGSLGVAVFGRHRHTGQLHQRLAARLRHHSLAPDRSRRHCRSASPERASEHQTSSY
jgi:DHA2 family methylenomycin A resistance protein-like MFS transporter